MKHSQKLILLRLLLPLSFLVLQLLSMSLFKKYRKLSLNPFKILHINPRPTFRMNECINIRLPSIPKLVNSALSDGFVPEDFKKAVVTPLTKKTSLPCDDMKNYCPVSGLCFMSILVERVLASQMIDQINLNGLDNYNQSANKVGHSIETALLSIKNEIHHSLSKGEASALLLDQPAIFDTIDHSTLLSCLQAWFDISGST